ncbi:MAG: cobyrinate a,c-diamide synthase [Eubacteriales bacterium]
MKLPRVLLTAPKSGCGKTTVVCGLLQVLKNRNLKTAAIKCGPDYIDPMFHREVIGAKSANLDLFFTDNETSKGILVKTAEGCDLAVMEGVMGYYDGLGGTTTTASAHHVSVTTDTPTILILDGKGASLSLCATAKGFAEFCPDSKIAGIILNRCSAMQYAMLQPQFREIGLETFGYVPNLPQFNLESRHLGLITAQEIGNLQEMLQGLAAELEKSLEIDKILALADGASDLESASIKIDKIVENCPRIAVAKDRAFCFYYNENLNILEELGGEIVYFSPLNDKKLPKCDALYLGGGYPELYGEKLENNQSMLADIHAKIASGLPTFAECGGFMYLHETTTDDNGKIHKLVGTILGNTHNIGKLSRFGYVNLIAQKDNLLCKAGESIGAHEFHYFDSEDNGTSCLAEKPTGTRKWNCVHSTETLFAGYPHIYFYGNLNFSRNFIVKASEYRCKNETI